MSTSGGSRPAVAPGGDAARRRTVNLSVLVTAQALYLFVTSIDLTLTGLVGYDLAPTPFLATLPFALISVAGTLSTAPASLLMVRTGRRAGFMLGSLFPVLGGLVSVRAIATGDFALFCAGTACVGVFQGFATYYRYAAADDALPERRPRAISTVLAGGVLAAVAGPFIATAGRDLLATEFAGSYLLVTVLGVASMLVLLPLRLPRPGRAGDTAADDTTDGTGDGTGDGTAAAAGAGGAAGAGDAAAAPPRPMREVLTQRVFLTGVTGTTTGYFVMMLLMTAAPISAMSHHHTVEQGALVVQWHLVGMFAPSLLSGHVVERFGAAQTLLAGVGVSLGGAVMAMLGTSQTHFMVSLAAIGVGWNLMQVAGTSLVVQSYRAAEGARTQATAESATAVAAALGSLCAGVLLDAAGWRNLNVVALALLVPAGVLTVSYLSRARAAAAAAAPAPATLSASD